MPVHESEPCYWDVRVDGKRPRTLANASYRDDDARSESEDDPEDVFKPGREHDNSSESDAEVPSTTKVIIHPRLRSKIIYRNPNLCSFAKKPTKDLATNVAVENKRKGITKVSPLIPFASIQLTPLVISNKNDLSDIVCRQKECERLKFCRTRNLAPAR